MRGSQAAERVARLGIDVARARLDVADAAVDEAQAICEIARIGSGVTSTVQAENDLEDARAERANARHRVEQAEAEAARATAFREHRKKEFDRFDLLASRGAIEPRLIDEWKGRYRAAQADELQAQARIGQARASVAVAEASVRVAEARCDLARAVSRLARDPGGQGGRGALEEALARFRRARVQRARSERRTARLEVERLEAKAEHELEVVAYRIKQVERLRQLADRRAVEPRLVDEQELALSEARHLRRIAEAAVKSARSRLESAEARLKSVEAEAGGIDSKLDPTSPAPGRN
jgi:multidrug resistance efflux pump